MGTNYYLEKKNGEMFTIPKESIAETIIRAYKTYEHDTIVIDRRDVFENVQSLHIGKSSMGWHFTLCIYPSLKIISLADYKRLFATNDYIIKDEDGKIISDKEMLDIITKRKANDFEKYESEEAYEEIVVKNINFFNSRFDSGKQYNSYEELLYDNNAERGLNGLWAHKAVIVSVEDLGFPDVEPLILPHFRTNGTYDLTTHYNFS